MNKHSFFATRFAAFALVMLTCTSHAFLLSEINSAAEKGDLVKVKLLLKGNPDLIFSKSGFGEMPLHFAAMSGNKDMVELLLVNNADVNTTNNLGWTPLHFAAAGGQKDVVDLLLTSNANVNAKNNSGETALHWAARNGHKEVAELLLAHQAEVNAKANDGTTPLNLAAYYDHTNMVELLLAHGAEVNIYYAAMSGDLAKLKTLIKDNPTLVFSKDIFGATPLFLAVQAGHKEAAKLLLANKADVNAGTGNVDTPLDVAAAGGYMDLVELLLANKADVNAKDKDGRTPLYYAEKDHHEDVAELLRQHGGQE